MHIARQGNRKAISLQLRVVPAAHRGAFVRIDLHEFVAGLGNPGTPGGLSARVTRAE